MTISFYSLQPLLLYFLLAISDSPTESLNTLFIFNNLKFYNQFFIKFKGYSFFIFQDFIGLHHSCKQDMIQSYRYNLCRNPVASRLLVSL